MLSVQSNLSTHTNMRLCKTIACSCKNVFCMYYGFLHYEVKVVHVYKKFDLVDVCKVLYIKGFPTSRQETQQFLGFPTGNYGFTGDYRLAENKRRPLNT